MKTRMRFLRHAESIGPMWPKSKSKPNPGAGTVPPPAGRPRAQVKERVGRAAPFSSSAMSSGRLSLDRVARQHCPSPFHRQAHPKSVPGSGTIDFQRTVNSVLTVCLSRGDNPTPISCPRFRSGPLVNLWLLSPLALFPACVPLPSVPRKPADLRPGFRQPDVILGHRLKLSIIQFGKILVKDLAALRASSA